MLTHFDRNQLFHGGGDTPKMLILRLRPFKDVFQHIYFRACKANYASENVDQKLVWLKVSTTFSKKEEEMNGSPRHDMDVYCEKEPARQKVPHCKYKISITRASHCGSVCLSVSVNVLHLDN